MGAARGEPSGGAIPMRGAAEPRLLSALRIGGLRENTAENGNRYFRMKEPPWWCIALYSRGIFRAADTKNELIYGEENQSNKIRG